MSCKAKETRNDIKEKGKASIEFYKEGKPQYYCYGYIDNMTDEIIEECKYCRKHVNYAQEDLNKYIKERNNNI